MRKALAFSILLALAMSAKPKAESQAWQWNLDSAYVALKSADSANFSRIESAILRLWSESGDMATDSSLRRGMQALKRYDLNEARSHFELVTKRRPAFAEGWNRLAHVEYLQNDLDNAILHVQAALKLDSLNFSAISGLGLIHERLGNYELAILIYGQALEINPWNTDLRSRLNALRIRRGMRLT